MNFKSLFVLFLLLLSCDTSQEVEKPKNFIGEDKLVKILVDASIHSAAKSQDRRMLEAKNVDIVVFLKV